MKKDKTMNKSLRDESPQAVLDTQPAPYEKTQAKKKTKDSVFCDLFQQPGYLLQLYQALHPEDTETTEDELDIVTIRNVLLDQMYNDLGFTAGKEKQRLLILVEAQSTWSVNIAVRAFMYLANTWQEYITNKKLNVYSSTKIELPKPELYVIYTGDRKKRQEWISLSEEFFPGQESAVDVKAKVIYDGKEGDIINQYVIFTRVYNEQVKQLGRTRDAVFETIRVCKEKNVLKEYLESREKEVVDIMMTLFDQEYAFDRYVEEKMAESEKKGVMKKAKETAYELADRKMTPETISEILRVSLNTVKQWLADRPIVTE